MSASKVRSNKTFMIKYYRKRDLGVDMAASHRWGVHTLWQRDLITWLVRGNGSEMEFANIVARKAPGRSKEEETF